MKVQVCGIDIGKTVFHLDGLSKEGHIVTKKRFSRKQLVTFYREPADLPDWHRSLPGCPLPRPCSSEARPRRKAHAGRVCQAFVKSNKNDYVDAEAIAEAVQRPTMRFVPFAGLKIDRSHRFDGHSRKGTALVLPKRP